MKRYSIGIIGCTGAVGKEIINVLFDKKFPIIELKIFASSRSAGKLQSTPFGDKTIDEFSLEKTKNLDFVFMAVSGDFSREYAKKIAENSIVIDNSSAWRYDDDIPLVCPEINASTIKNNKLIANPNCSTLILAVALYPLYREFGLKKCIVSTYQATSGGGQPAMEELERETKNYLNGDKVNNNNFVHPIPFNIIPHIDTFQDNGYTREEMKVTWETRKIFNIPSFKISATAVRIPTFRAHAESVTIETEKKVDINRAKLVLSNAKGVELVDNVEDNIYPMPLTASKKYDVEVGRIRKSIVYEDFGLDFFVCGDQILKGAALNAVQIAESLLDKN